MNWLKKQAGFGMVEVMVSFALLGAGIFTIMEGLDYLEREKTITDKNVSMENMLSSIVDSVRSNIIMEKVDFQATSNWLNNSTAQAVKDSLKMCWVKDGLIPIANYPNCPGRLGYVVSPMTIGILEVRGLYFITVRMTHDELYPNNFKQYQFIVRGP
jgi:hypothetical protein